MNACVNVSENSYKTKELVSNRFIMFFLLCIALTKMNLCKVLVHI